MNGKDYRIGLLKCYDYLSGYIEQADFSIYNKALGTHNFGCGVKEDTSIQVESIIKLINQKNQLVNIHNFLTRALNAMEEESRKLIVMRYVKKKDVNKVMDKLGMSKGSYYRRMEKALNQFGEYLRIEEGVDKNWFFENYFSKRWFRKLVDFSSEGGCF